MNLTRYSEEAAAVAEKAAQCGRDPQSVKLIAVSKTVGLQAVADAIAQGATDFGENRPDCLMEKADAFPNVRWHFIGNIQSRRIRDIVGRASLIHSLFDADHGQKISACAAQLGIIQDVLMEVNVSGELSKSGVAPADAPQLLARLSGLDNLRVCGLMTMAPAGDLAAATQAFEGLAALRETLAAQLPPEQAAVFTELSMGMSDDWPQAIQCGATMVRIGRAIFSADYQ